MLLISILGQANLALALALLFEEQVKFVETKILLNRKRVIKISPKAIVLNVKFSLSSQAIAMGQTKLE